MTVKELKEKLESFPPEMDNFQVFCLMFSEDFRHQDKQLTEAIGINEQIKCIDLISYKASNVK